MLLAYHPVNGGMGDWNTTPQPAAIVAVHLAGLSLQASILPHLSICPSHASEWTIKFNVDLDD